MTPGDDLIEQGVKKMLHGQGYTPRPMRCWRMCPFIQASRKAEFKPIPTNMSPEIRKLPEDVRMTLQGCKVFQPPQIAEYNNLLRRDGKLVSGVDKLGTRSKTRLGRLYHKFDSLCALATSKEGRLILIQHREFHHVFYPVCYHPAHEVYNEILNKYERRWSALNESYGKPWPNSASSF
jgi:hypothetical protein